MNVSGKTIPGKSVPGKTVGGESRRMGVNGTVKTGNVGGSSSVPVAPTSGAGGASGGGAAAAAAAAAAAVGNQPAHSQYPSNDVNRLLLELLNKKGFHRMEVMLRTESSRTLTPYNYNSPASPKNMTFINPQEALHSITKNRSRIRPVTNPYQSVPTKRDSDGNPVPSPQSDSINPDDYKIYIRSFFMLKNWIAKNLSIHKVILRDLILYPVFVTTLIKFYKLNEVDVLKTFYNENASSVMNEENKFIIIELYNKLTKESEIKLEESNNEQFKNSLDQYKFEICISQQVFYSMISFLLNHYKIGGQVILGCIFSRIEVQLINSLKNNSIKLNSIEPIGNVKEDVSDRTNSQPNTSNTEDRDSFDSSSDKFTDAESNANDLFEDSFSKEENNEDTKEDKIETVDTQDNQTKEEPEETAKIDQTQVETKGLDTEHIEKIANEESEDSKGEKIISKATEDSTPITSSLEKEDDTKTKEGKVDVDSKNEEDTKPDSSKNNNMENNKVTDSDSIVKASANSPKQSINVPGESRNLESTPASKVNLDNSKAITESAKATASISKLQHDIQKFQEITKSMHIMGHQTALPSVRMYTYENAGKTLSSLDFNNDYSMAATGFQDSYIKIWSLQGNSFDKTTEKADSINSIFKTLVGHSDTVYSVNFSPCNNYLLSGSGDKTARLWSMDSFEGLVSYKGHEKPIWDVSFSPIGNNLFVTGSGDLTARLWSCDRVYPIRIMAGHLNDVDCVSFHPNGHYVFTGSSDRTCRMWDINTGDSTRLFIGHSSPVTSCAVSPDGRWISTGNEDGTITVWDIGSGKKLKSMRGHGKNSIYSLSYNKTGDILVSAGADNSVRVWDIKKNTHEPNLEPEEAYSGLGNNNTTSMNQDIKEYGRRRTIVATNDLLATYFTKKTPVYKVKYTSTNLLIAGGTSLA